MKLEREYVRVLVLWIVFVAMFGAFSWVMGHQQGHTISEIWDQWLRQLGM